MVRGDGKLGQVNKMNIILLGAAGFIGKNLAIKLSKNCENRITLIDRTKDFFADIKSILSSNVVFGEDSFNEDSDFDSMLMGQDIVYHLVSTTIPATSNQHISQEIAANVGITVNMLEACVRCNVKKVIFFSSGGTVYGKDAKCPISEDVIAYPISSYGLQKVTIEKLLYLFWYMYGLDYRVIRLSNPYGPYQRPNGVLGAVTTFTYKALKNEKIIVYGDGTIIRDFIYIDDVINAIVNVVDGGNKFNTYNVGCGYGTSINKVLEIVGIVLGKSLKIEYMSGRKMDVPENFLDISRYEECYGKLSRISLYEGIIKTADFMKQNSIV